jgi:hypothetical protein
VFDVQRSGFYLGSRLVLWQSSAGYGTVAFMKANRTFRPAGGQALYPRPRVLQVQDGAGEALVMIGPVRGPAHLEVIHRERFYHVPVSAIAPSRVAVRCIAFYEPAGRFGTRAGHIRQYAEVLRVSRVRRSELPGLSWPGRRGEEVLYYRFDLAAPISLPRPIANPEGRRVAFRFPPLDRLRRAETIRDL